MVITKPIDALIEKDGVYADFYRKQLLEEEISSL